MNQNETQTRSFFTRVSHSLEDFGFFVKTFLDDILAALFSFSRLAGILRFILFFIGGIAFWVFYTAQTRDLSYWDFVFREVGRAVLFFVSENPINTLAIASLRAVVFLIFALWNLVKNMVSAEILRHVVVVVIPVLIAARVAVIYLADIFELKGEKIALGFLFKATFALGYQRMVIEDGDVAKEHRDSPMHNIGGPGQVQVNLENVAVFDRIDGSIHMIPPTSDQWKDSAVIESFERLREVIDLRDQITEAQGMALEARTRDGIRIAIQDIRLIYSVVRKRSSDDELSFDESAIERLVYRRTVGRWQKVMENLVRSQLRQFVAEHNLSEFLAAAEIPVLNENRPNRPSGDALQTHFVPRPIITQRFMSHGFQQRAYQNGLELHWIDIGTWSFPTQLIPERHLQAWKIVCENEVRRREKDMVRREARAETLLSLVRDYPLTQFKGLGDEDLSQETGTFVLIESYLKLLRSAAATYPAEDVPLELGKAIHFLSHYLNTYLAKSGQARILGGSEQD